MPRKRTELSELLLRLRDEITPKINRAKLRFDRKLRGMSDAERQRFNSEFELWVKGVSAEFESSKLRGAREDWVRAAEGTPFAWVFQPDEPPAPPGAPTGVPAGAPVRATRPQATATRKTPPTIPAFAGEAVTTMATLTKDERTLLRVFTPEGRWGDACRALGTDPSGWRAWEARKALEAKGLIQRVTRGLYRRTARTVTTQPKRKGR